MVLLWMPSQFGYIVCYGYLVKDVGRAGGGTVRAGRAARVPSAAPPPARGTAGRRGRGGGRGSCSPGPPTPRTLAAAAGAKNYKCKKLRTGRVAADLPEDLPDVGRGAAAELFLPQPDHRPPVQLEVLSELGHGLGKQLELLGGPLQPDRHVHVGPTARLGRYPLQSSVRWCRCCSTDQLSSELAPGGEGAHQGDGGVPDGEVRPGNLGIAVHSISTPATQMHSSAGWWVPA